jgi:hypothetical protein
VLASWIPAFNPVHGKYSPGLVLQVTLAREAADLGIRRIDLGRGYNQTKSSLMSGALPMALGTVDRRPLCRMLRSGWYRAGNLVRTTPLDEPARRAYHRLRSFITAARPRCGQLTSPDKRNLNDKL